MKEKIIEILDKEGNEITIQTENMTIYWDKYDSADAIVAFIVEQCQKRDELIKAQDEYIKKVDWIIGNHEMSNMILTRIRREIQQIKNEINKQKP